MSAILSRRVALFIMHVVICSGPVVSAEIFKWTGPDGITRYSESAPVSYVRDVEVLSLVETDPAPASGKEIDRVLEVAKVLETSRLERENQRLRQKIQRDEYSRQQQLKNSSPEYENQYPGWAVSYPYRSRFQRRFSYRHRYPSYGQHNRVPGTRYRSRHKAHAGVSGRMARIDFPSSR